MANDSKSELVDGEILAHGSDYRRLQVRLTSGEEIAAMLPKHKKFGCLFGTLVGWKVKVILRLPPQMPRVVELTAPGKTTGSVSESQSRQ